MAFLQIFKVHSKESQGTTLGRDTGGIALFMVLASISLLTILVTDFTYIAHISQSIAYGGLDQAQAHYLAKSGLKLSLLRLKGYQQIKGLLGQLSAATGGGPSLVPNGVVNKIWNYPFFYPLPTNIPGMTSADKDLIAKFQKEVAIEGRFSAIIESESSKYNINLIVPGFITPPSPSPSASPTLSLGTPPDATAARDNLSEQIQSLLNQKFESDPDFAMTYRDFRVPDFIDQLASWADRTYERRSSPSQDLVPMKRAPFYTLGELHNLPNIDEDLYDLIAPNFTASMTNGININTMQEPTLRSLAPLMTKTEVSNFFTFRDSETADNQFQKPDDFFDYLSKSVVAYQSNPKKMDELKAAIVRRNITLITDETNFRITVQATVNSATQTIVAWVTLGPPVAPLPKDNTGLGGTGNGLGGGTPPNPNIPAEIPDSNIKITYMRIY